MLKHRYSPRFGNKSVLYPPPPRPTPPCAPPRGAPGLPEKTSGGLRELPNLERPQISDAMKKIKTKVFRNFRPPGALSGPWERQETTQDEKLVLGKSPGLPGTAY